MDSSIFIQISPKTYKNNSLVELSVSLNRESFNVLFNHLLCLHILVLQNEDCYISQQLASEFAFNYT